MRGPRLPAGTRPPSRHDGRCSPDHDAALSENLDIVRISNDESSSVLEVDEIAALKNLIAIEGGGSFLDDAVGRKLSEIESWRKTDRRRRSGVRCSGTRGTRDALGLRISHVAIGAGLVDRLRPCPEADEQQGRHCNIPCNALYGCHRRPPCNPESHPPDGGAEGPTALLDVGGLLVAHRKPM